jgi:hypothetical protein
MSNDPHPHASPAGGRSGDVHRIERTQTGVRIEKRILKVLKGLAEYHDLSLGDLLEGIVLHAFEGTSPFGDRSLAVIADLKRIYDLDLDASASHLLVDCSAEAARDATTEQPTPSS